MDEAGCPFCFTIDGDTLTNQTVTVRDRDTGRNTNGSIAQTIERFVPVVKQAHDAGLLVRGYVSCVIACPFEGAISPAKVVAVVDQLAEIGVDEFDLGDTIGAATPDTTRRMLEAVATRHALGDEIRPVTLHLHDTFGHAAACVLAALEMGVRSFDGAAGGLGGCPYASTPDRRAPGNIATELLMRTILEAGYDCGIDDDALADAGAFARGLI
jgi:hydroxymethylglutaryl-CoA lyase